MLVKEQVHYIEDDLRIFGAIGDDLFPRVLSLLEASCDNHAKFELQYPEEDSGTP